MATFKDLVRRQAEGKALNPNPAWEDPGRPVGLVDLNLGRIAGQSPSRSLGGMRLTQKAAARHLSAYAGDQAMDWVMDCTRYYSDAVSNAEYHFETPGEPDATKKPKEGVKVPPMLQKLLEEPNPYMDYIEMMELFTFDLLLTGNAYWFKWMINDKKQPLALYRLAPPYVEVATSPWGPANYVYQIPNADKVIIQPEEIIHWKLGNPDSANPYFGAGIIQGAGRAADLEISLTHTQASYYDNKAMPSLAVSSERRVPRDVFKKMRAQLRGRTQGPRNAGELLVLEAGLKLEPIAPNATDAAFVAVSKMSRDRVFSWFKMHPCLVGIQDEATPVGLMSECQNQFDTKAMKPFLNKTQTKMTADLIKAWDLKIVYDYEYQLTPEDRAKLAGSVGHLPGVTVDEVREIGGWGPHPEKEIGKMTLNLPGQEGGGGRPGEAPTRNGFPDRNLPREAGRPPNASNTRAFPKKGEALPKGAKAVAGKKSLGEINDRLEYLIANPASNEPVDQLTNERTRDVDAVTSHFVGDLKRASHVLERGLLDTIEGKAFDSSDVAEKIRNSKAWGNFNDYAKEAYEQALMRVMSHAVIHHGKLGMTGEVDYEALTKDLVGRKDTGVKAITKSFKNVVSKHVKENRDDRLAAQEAVQEAVGEWNHSHAPMVALTEATRGYNEATLAVASKAGIDKVYVTDGTDDDEPCVNANGSTWTVEYAREHALEHPRCRRAFVPIARDKVEE